MIYYSVAVLMLAGVREILVITRAADIKSFKRVLGDGSALGLAIEYRAQNKPRGIAEAFVIGRDFIERHRVALILGDNIFFGGALRSILRRRSRCPRRHQLRVRSRIRALRHPRFDRKKPIRRSPIRLRQLGGDRPISSMSRFQRSPQLRPSARRAGITITTYLRAGRLAINSSAGMLWLDVGALRRLAAGNSLQAVETRQGLKIASLEGKLLGGKGSLIRPPSESAKAQRGTPSRTLRRWRIEEHELAEHAVARSVARP
jgi:glucose-1-phosphate thymidylyltransferase